MAGSTVVIKYDGTDITTDVLFSSARFECQQNAVPGTWEFTVKDVAHTYSFVTGKEIELTIDGVKMVGGFLLQVGRGYPFSAMDTTTVDPGDTTRYWRLRGVDYNVLFDKRVLRNTTDYLHQIPNFTGDKMDGELIKQLCADYLDVTELDTVTFVDDIRPPFNGTPDATKQGAWLQQGSMWRKQMMDFTQFTGALFYIDANKNLHHHAIEDTVMRWGFSDTPNKAPITASPATYQGSTIGPREINAVESGEHMVNDALVWGGSQWAGSGGTVFARETDAVSIAAHGRWQLAEVHFGEEGYKLQEGVNVRADIIVNGPPGAVAADQNRGLRYPQWTFGFAWFAHQVPTISGIPDHILPGYLSTITMETFEDGVNPLVQLLPLRSMVITFPDLDTTGKGYVRFDGQFGLQPDDPFTLWRFLLKNRQRIINPVLTVVDNSSTATLYGAIGHFTPDPTPNGTVTVFTVPFGYIAGTTNVYIDGLIQTPVTDYTESDPIAGEVTFVSAPTTGQVIQVVCRTLAS